MNGLAALSDRDTVRVHADTNSSTYAELASRVAELTSPYAELASRFAHLTAVGSVGSVFIDSILLDNWALVKEALTSQVADVPEQLQADWKSTVEQQIGDLATLTNNWDSYGAPTIDAALIADAKVFASRLATPGARTPSVVPTVNGTVQLEWHTRAYDAEVEIMADHRYYVFIRPVDGQPWEGETTLNEAVDRLGPLFAR